MSIFKISSFFSFALMLTFLSGRPAFSQTSTKYKEGYTGENSPTSSDTVPDEIKNVGIDEHLGDSIDLSLMVTTDKGELVPLSTFFSKGHPVLFSLIYYNCPGLCSLHFNGVIESLKNVDWSPGKEFQVVALSFDAKENFELGAKKKANYMKMYGRPGTEDGFHFVNADQKTIDAITQSVGFKFKWNDKAGEWSHASAAILISPEGKITRYLHGIEFNPKDMKLALNEAGNGKVGTIIDSAIMYCFKYDQHQSRYGLHVFRLVQIGGLIMIGLLAMWLVPHWIRSRREKV